MTAQISAQFDAKLHSLESRVNTFDDALTRERKNAEQRWERLDHHMAAVESHFSKWQKQAVVTDMLIDRLRTKGVLDLSDLQIPSAPAAAVVSISAPSASPEISNGSASTAAHDTHTHTHHSSAKKRPSGGEQQAADAEDAKPKRQNQSKSPPARSPAKASSTAKPKSSRNVFSSSEAPSAGAGQA